MTFSELNRMEDAEERNAAARALGFESAEHAERARALWVTRPHFWEVDATRVRSEATMIFNGRPARDRFLSALSPSQTTAPRACPHCHGPLTPSEHGDQCLACQFLVSEEGDKSDGAD